MAKVKVVANRSGIKELLRDPAVKATLVELGERVAAAAGPDTVIVEDLSGNYRARVEVHDVSPGAIETEARTGRLQRALDAA